jgi:hypothetical protein
VFFGSKTCDSNLKPTSLSWKRAESTFHLSPKQKEIKSHSLESSLNIENPKDVNMSGFYSKKLVNWAMSVSDINERFIFICHFTSVWLRRSQVLGVLNKELNGQLPIAKRQLSFIEKERESVQAREYTPGGRVGEGQALSKLLWEQDLQLKSTSG